MNTNTLFILCSDPEAVFAVAAPSRIDVSPDAAAPLPTEIVWMPAGRHTISAGTLAGGTWQGTVICDQAAFARVSESFAKMRARGPVSLDFDHEDKAASAWVQGFAWDASRGIIASVEWSGKGAEALREKTYYSFSPAFLCDKETGRVNGLVYGHAAGGLVNSPAFGAAMPALIAARLSGTELNPEQGGTPATSNTKNMKERLIAMLAALGVKHDPNASDEALLSLLSHYNTEQATVAARMKTEVDTAKAEAIAAKNAEVAARKSRVDVAVQAAVADGRIPAEHREKWVAIGCSDEGALSLIPQKHAPVAAPATKTTDVQVRAGFVDTAKAMHASNDHVARGQIFRDMRAFVQARSGEVMEVLAANSLGSLAGDLIVLRALDLLKLSFPVLGQITTDFSAEQAKHGQVITTRIISIPSVVALNDTTGWATSDATAADVSITIGQPKGVQISYGSTELAKTGRDLFGEQIEACHYALAKDMVDALYAVITAGNFAGATTKATASVARLDLVAMEKALALRGVQGQLSFLANADIYERMQLDTSVVSLATFQKPEVITGSGLPPIAGFNMIRAINLPATGNLTGFGFRKDALVLATRIPEDYMRTAPAGATHGAMSIVTNPDVGISVQKTDFVDHILARAYSRIAWAYGVAKGNGSSGQRLISA